MKYLIVCAFFYLLPNNLYSQVDCNYLEKNYYPLIYEAEIAFIQDSIEVAYEKYKEAELICELKHSSYNQEMNNYLKILNRLGEYDKASYYLKKLVADYGYSVDFLDEHYDFAKLGLDRRELEKAYADFYNKDRQKIIDCLIVMEENDQILRHYNIDFLPSEYLYLDAILDQQNLSSYQQARDSLVKVIKETRKYESYSQVACNTDSLNLLKMKTIVKEFGFPNLRLVGSEYVNYSDPFALFIHFAGDVELENIMLDQIKKGECTPLLYGLMMDRKACNKKEKYKYGLNEDVNDTDIEDLENVDMRRELVGLPTMKMVLDRKKAIANM